MTLPRHRPIVVTKILMAALLAVTACASGGGSSATARADELSATTFAPTLSVDLAAMRATPRGAYVRDVREGDGLYVRSGETVQVRYAGWLADGTAIDAVGERDAPVSFRVGGGQVVRGWEEAVVGMRVGGRRQVVIPPRLGYGARGLGNVPPNAVLVFLIDVVGVR